ncbi:uncharacterized protein LOC120449858 [Drosophila santomea]|uniref:uncharacterized protein LOC120449858 n=1 Tax=Drosophila santomea TaxID=129105 RepID=UPI001CCB4F99|nr:uncharacterized protein LOC120449858 [Drosophila santomea]
MGCYIHFNLFCVLLLVDFGQPDLEYTDYGNSEAHLDDHLTRPDVDVADSHNEMTMSYDYHNEHHDSTIHPDPQVELSTNHYDESHDDLITTGMDGFESNHHDHQDHHVEHEVEDRIVRYALHKRHEEI